MNNKKGWGSVLMTVFFRVVRPSVAQLRKSFMTGVLDKGVK